MNKVRFLFLRITDFCLCALFIVIGYCVALAISFLIVLSKKIKKVNPEQKRDLLVFSEASDYDSMKAVGAISLLPNWLIGGYFKKVYVVFFPTSKKRVVDEIESFEIIELGSIARFLKQSKMMLSYTLANAIYYFWQVFRMRGFVEDNISVVHGAGVHHTALAALLLRRLTGLPTCVSVHSDDEFRYKFMKDYGGHWKIMASRWCTVQIHKFIFSMAPRIFIIRESLKDWAIRMGASPKRIRLFPHVVNTDDLNCRHKDNLLSNYGLDGRHPVVFAGRLSKENYVYDIIRIATIVSKINKDAVFLIVGNGIERNQMENAVAEARLENFVRFLGYQPREKVFEFRRQADVNLCLMAGFSLIEAALSGRPIVSYDVEWHYELVRNEKTGFLIREHDVGAAADAIVKLIVDQELAKRLGENARALAIERHDSKIVQKQRASLYEELIKEN